MAKLLGTSCPGYELSWVRVVLGTSCLGYESSWVRVVLGTSRPGYELSWVRVVLGTSCLGYELSIILFSRIMETITGPLHVVHCLPVDSPHGCPVKWEAFRCDDSIIINLHFRVRIWSKMAQAEIIQSAAILDWLVTKIADVLRTVFSSYFVDIKCSCVKCHCGMPLVVQSKIRHH